MRQRWGLAPQQHTSPGLEDKVLFTATATVPCEQTAAAATKRGCAMDGSTVHEMVPRVGARDGAQSQARRKTLPQEIAPPRVPSAVVPADYRMTIATLKDDRVLNGVLRDQTARTVTIQSQTGLTTLERTEIESLQDSALSVMPEGLLESLKPDDRRDLLGYLMHPQQVALPK